MSYKKSPPTDTVETSRPRPLAAVASGSLSLKFAAISATTCYSPTPFISGQLRFFVILSVLLPERLGRGQQPRSFLRADPDPRSTDRRS
jgi:hypothetical protein